VRVRKWSSPRLRTLNVFGNREDRLHPVGKRVVPVPVRMVAPALTATCLITTLVTGCEYTPQPEATDTATASTSAPPSPTAVTNSLNGITERNQFHLAVRYTCVEGDTWETVASGFGLKPDVLKQFNKSTTLRAGSTVDLRGRDVPQLGAGGSVSSSPDGTLSYGIAAGDTLSGITSRFGVPQYALRVSNPTLPSNGEGLLLTPGQQLTVPNAL